MSPSHWRSTLSERQPLKTGSVPGKRLKRLFMLRAVWFERSASATRTPKLGALRPSEVRRADVQSFADGLLGTLSGHSASTILNPLQAFYRRAIDRRRTGERADLQNPDDLCVYEHLLPGSYDDEWGEDERLPARPRRGIVRGQSFSHPYRRD
jgi:hypothetical protein